MHLDTVWVIYRSDSKPAKEAALSCVKKIKSLGIKVITSISNPGNSPFQKLLSSLKELPSLKIWISLLLALAIILLNSSNTLDKM